MAGTRDVVNSIGVTPPEEDSASEIADAVTVILAKNPLVRAAQIRIEAQDAVVTLHGAVASETKRRAAERDAWCTFAVDDVINRLIIVPG